MIGKREIERRLIQEQVDFWKNTPHVRNFLKLKVICKEVDVDYTNFIKTINGNGYMSIEKLMAVRRRTAEVLKETLEALENI